MITNKVPIVIRRTVETEEYVLDNLTAVVKSPSSSDEHGSYGPEYKIWITVEKVILQ